MNDIRQVPILLDYIIGGCPRGVRRVTNPTINHTINSGVTLTTQYLPTIYQVKPPFVGGCSYYSPQCVAKCELIHACRETPTTRNLAPNLDNKEMYGITVERFITV